MLSHTSIKICLLIFIVTLTGCSTLKMREDGSMVRRHFGYTKIILPPTESGKGQFSALEVSNIGLSFAKGVGLGYYFERTEHIPLDCRLVIRVVNEEQLREVVDKLSNFKEGLCVTVDPE